jgi:DNA-binding transcriptional LysR family regulator
MQWTERIGRRLKLRDLHILLAVAKSGSMGRAATELAMSQPAVSKAIADLEYALGLRLLDRGPQGIEPTMYGRALLKCGLAVFDDLRQGVKELEFLADPAVGELSIGCTEPLSAGFVSVLVDRFTKDYPRAALRVVSADLVTLQYRELSQRNVEMAFVPMPGQLPEQEASTELLLDDRNVILAAAHNKWTRRRKIALSDLIEEPWVLPPPDSPVGSYLAAAFRAGGVEPPRACVRTFSIPLYQRLLATGRFLTSLPVSMLRHDPTLRRLSVEFPSHSRPIGIMTLKNRMLSPLAELFIELARRVAKQIAKGQAFDR